MTRACIYCRISRDRAGAGLGVDRQEADGRELAARNGWDVVFVLTDNDLSAYSGKPRPGYLKLLDEIRADHVDVVIAWHSDRLHRSPVELEEYIAACESRGVPTHTVTAGPIDLATPSGRLVARQLGAVARYEVEHMIERQQRAKLQAAVDGLWKGGRRPFGYAADGVTVVAEEAAEIVRMSRAVLAGASLMSLADELNQRGILTSTGSAWRQDGVRGVLLRARNAGLMRHQGRVIGAAAWPAIVDEGVWRAVDAVLRDPKRRANFTAGRRWLGGGLFLCGVCADGTTCHTIKGTNSRPQARTEYACSKIKHVTRSAQDVDDLVAETIIERCSRADAAQLLDDVDSHQDTAGLHDRAVELRGRLNGLARLFGAEAIDERQLAEGSAPLRSQLNDIERQMADVVPGRSVLAALVGADDVAEAWEALDLGQQRTAIDALITVTLLPSSKGRPAGWKPGGSYFRAETVRIDWRRKSP